VKAFRKNESGQILIICVLVVSLVILSTQLHIYDVAQSLHGVSQLQTNSFLFSIIRNSRNVVVSSLVNVSSGGNSSVLLANLNTWASFLRHMPQSGTPHLTFEVAATPYVNGTQLVWGNNGFGVTSAYCDFDVSFQDQYANTNMTFPVNVTTSTQLFAYCQSLGGNLKQVDVTGRVFNEDTPALAQNMAVLFQNATGHWLPGADQPGYRFVDSGTGVYTARFEVDTPQPTVSVSLQVTDLRSIYVQANATCIGPPQKSGSP
jgi:hypothetical protein